MEVELCSVKQIFEEDDLSMSETDRNRFSPLQGKKRKLSLSHSLEPNSMIVAPNSFEDQKVQEGMRLKAKKVSKVRKDEKPQVAVRRRGKGAVKGEDRNNLSRRSSMTSTERSIGLDGIIVLSD